MRDAMNGRFHRREGDGWGITMLQFFIAWVTREAKAKALLLVGAVCTVTGSFLMWAVMRFLVVDQVMAQDAAHSGRMAAIEAGAAVLEARFEAVEQRVGDVEENTGTLIRAECLRTSLADQALLRMTCPANLFRGAPR